MTTREIRVVTQHEADRATLVQTIEQLGHHVIDAEPAGTQDVAAVIVVDEYDSSDSEIRAELAAHGGRVVKITNRADRTFDSHWDRPTSLYVVSDNSALGYDIALRLCAQDDSDREIA